MQKIRFDKTRNGFSLAEAMLATVILALAAAGVLLPFTAGAKLRVEGRRRTLAANLASAQMEKFIATDFDDLVANGAGYVDEPVGQIRDSAGTVLTDPVYENFSRGASFQYDPTQPFFIIVSVWVEYNGDRIVTLTRLITR